MSREEQSRYIHRPRWRGWHEALGNAVEGYIHCVRRQDQGRGTEVRRSRGQSCAAGRA
jgi:hypothetical protein